MARRPPLRCWWDGIHVADIEQHQQPWQSRCRYTDAAIDGGLVVGAPLLSCSLPVGSRWADATNFFRGLLPEGRHLQAVADLAKVPTNHYYDLLERFGRDIAGAIVITGPDEGPQPRDSTVEPYTGDALDGEIALLGDDNPLGLHADSELSIAGVQNKLLLVAGDDGTWGRPVHGYPSTHILKVDHDRYPGLVRAEGECLTLAHAVGLTNAPPQVAIIGGRDCIIVERYDRYVDDEGTIRRTHQEDACQALNVDITANRNRGKYESDGGPSLSQIARLLSLHAEAPERELEGLMTLTTFTVVIGNADLHGKNISYLHDPDGRISLAPAYDTVPTMLWPNLRATSAVTVAGVSTFDDMTLDAISEEAAAWGLDRHDAWSIAADTVEAIKASVDVVARPDLNAAISKRASRLLKSTRRPKSSRAVRPAPADGLGIAGAALHARAGRPTSNSSVGATVPCGGQRADGRPCGVRLRPGSTCPSHGWTAPVR